MADNFNLKQYLVENKLGSYSKAVLSEEDSKHDPINPDDPYATGPMQGGMFEEGTSDSRMLASLDMLEDKLDNLIRNTTTNSNIPTADKVGLVNAFNEMKELVYTIGSDIEQEEEEEFISDYSKRRAAEK